MQDQEKTDGDGELRYFINKPIRSSKVVTPARRDVDITLYSIEPQDPK